MTDEESHRALRELIGAYLLGHLDEHEAARVRAHLDGCASCRAEVAELATLPSLLRDVDVTSLTALSGPAGEPGPLLGRRIAAQVGAERRTRRRRTTGARVLVGAAACLVLVATLLAGGRLLGEGPASPVPLEAVAVTSERAGVVARADLVDHTWGIEIKLVATGLPGGRPYRATVRGADGVDYPAGAFVGVDGVEVRCNMNAAVLRGDAVAFTVWDQSDRVVLQSRF